MLQAPQIAADLRAVASLLVYYTTSSNARFGVGLLYMGSLSGIQRTTPIILSRVRMNHAFYCLSRVSALRTVRSADCLLR